MRHDGLLDEACREVNALTPGSSPVSPAELQKPTSPPRDPLQGRSAHAKEAMAAAELMHGHGG